MFKKRIYKVFTFFEKYWQATAALSACIFFSKQDLTVVFIVPTINSYQIDVLRRVIEANKFDADSQRLHQLALTEKKFVEMDRKFLEMDGKFLEMDGKIFNQSKKLDCQD